MNSQSLSLKERRDHRRALGGSLAGSSIEWFDFFLYATAAALIFDKQFFPSEDPFVSQMLSYFSLALTFFIRPFGGVIFAHIGDKIGRKKTLVITLSLMGGATVAIGLLPTADSIGIWAPILLVLCRLIQGAAIGGEWGGALLLAYEYAPQHRKGLYGSVPQMGVTVGMLLGTVAFSLVSLLPDGQFEAWGWRLPFISSVVLVFLGLWLRKGIDETPDFKQAKESNTQIKMPLVETLSKHRKAVLVSAGVKFVETGPFYIFAVFVVGYATGTLDYSRPLVLNLVSIAALIATVLIPVCGALSDKLGRVTVYRFGAALIGLFLIPFFLLLDLRADWALAVAIIVSFGLIWPPVTSTLGTMMSESFSTEVRYTGITLGYQLGAALVGGTAPLIATWLMKVSDGSWWPVAWYFVAIAVVSLVASLGVGVSTVRQSKVPART